MKVNGLDGKLYNLKGEAPLLSDNRKRSSLHVRARALIKEAFPNELILEEVFLPGTKGLKADFLLTCRRLIVEVNGIQHSTFIEHFHHTKLGFLQSVQRDNRKSEWAELNDFQLITLNYDESDEQWRRHLRE